MSDYIRSDRPHNPCLPDTVEGCAFDVLMTHQACIAPVARETVMHDTQSLYAIRTGKHTMLSSVDRMLRGGADSMLATKLAEQGWTLCCPTFDGKRLDGKVMIQPAGV